MNMKSTLEKDLMALYNKYKERKKEGKKELAFTDALGIIGGM
jgi:hypothetical protein